MKSTLRQLLLVRRINDVVFRARFVYLAKIRRAVRISPELAHVHRKDYSFRMLLKGSTSHRPLRLIRPLSVIDALDKNSRILSVGCRFETELLYLIGHGWSMSNIRGLDIVAYSPWVDVGNMHAMPYNASSWDAVVLGWVISYSEAPDKVAAEVVRVTRDRGLVAIAVSYYPDRQSDSDVTAEGERLRSVDALLGLFRGHVREVFFRHDPPDPAREGVCAVVFSIKKGGAR